MNKISQTHISFQNFKDIQILFSIVAVAGLVLFSINLLAGDKSRLPVIESLQSPPVINTVPLSDFAKMDINHDGKLSRQEANADAVLTSGFEVVDTDVNGSLDSNEYSVYIITTAPN